LYASAQIELPVRELTGAALLRPLHLGPGDTALLRVQTTTPLVVAMVRSRPHHEVDALAAVVDLRAYRGQSLLGGYVLSVVERSGEVALTPHVPAVESLLAEPSLALLFVPAGPRPGSSRLALRIDVSRRRRYLNDPLHGNCREEKGASAENQALRLQLLSASCGDGRIDANEECDDGNRLDSDGCSAFCGREGGIR
jgi:cysteine-rich repeat protein